MKRKIISILLVVVTAFSFTYAAADVLSQYDSWLSVCDFDSILADLESGGSGIVGRDMFTIRDIAETCKDILTECTFERDDFTGETRITHSLLKEFSKDCQVFPFIDENGLNLFVGFQYKSALHYDKIYLNFGDQIIEYNRSDKKHGFGIQFERLNGKSWEYSLLTGIELPGENLLSVSFRENGSVSKVDYVLTENEMVAVNALDYICRKSKSIRSTVQAIVRRK